MRTKFLLVALLAFSAFGLSGCYVSTVTVRSDAFTTTNCYWETVNDGYGYYEQQYCWSPYYGGYRAYHNGGYYVRRGFSPGYRGAVRVRIGGPVIVTPRRVDPAPVIVRPRPPRRPGRYYAMNVARESLSVTFDANTVNAISLEGNAFASSAVSTQQAPVSRITLEVVVAGVNKESAQALVTQIAEGKDLSRGQLTLGEGVSADSAYIESLNVLVPAGRRVSVR